MPAPTFQAAGTAVYGTTASGTVAWPAHVANDVALLVVETTGNAATIAAPSGWTAVTGSPITDVATIAGSKLHVFWNRATSSSMPSVASYATTDHVASRIFTFRGVTTSGNPWDVVATGIKTTASSTATAPSVTTTFAETRVVMIVGRPNDNNSTAHFGTWVNANLTGISEHGEAGTANGNGGGFKVGSGEKTTAGATGTATATKIASTTDTYMTLALKPVQDPPTVALNTADATAFGTDTTPTLEFTGTDIQGNDVRYQVLIENSVNKNDIDNSVASSLIGTTTTRMAQSFELSTAQTIRSVTYLLAKTATVTHTLSASIYAHSGTFGAGGLPSGAALATSTNTYDGDTLPLTSDLQGFEIVTFYFAGYAAAVGTYAISIEQTGATTGFVRVATNTSVETSHPGNAAIYNSGSWFTSAGDLIFYIGTTAQPVITASSTSAGFLNTVNGGDTDPFTSGQKVSYTVQPTDALTTGTYYWRVRGIDPLGSNTYGAWSGTRSFTVNATSYQTPTLIQTKKQNGGNYVNGGTITFDSNVAAGSFLVLAIGTASTATVVSMTDNRSNGWSLATKVASPDREVAIWYAPNAAAGSTTVTYALTSGQFVDTTIIMREYSGIVSATPLDVIATASTSDYLQSVSATTGATTQTHELVIAADTVSNNAAGFVAGSGLGNLDTQDGFDSFASIAIADRLTTTTGTQSGSYTTTSFSRHSLAIATFKAAVTGGGGTTGQIKAWGGSSFVAKPVKVWTGSAWVTKPLKRWSGSTWVTTPY